MVKRLSSRQIRFSRALNPIFRRNQPLSSFDKRYVYMLIDDVANGICPFRHTPNVNFQAILTTSPIEADTLVREAFYDRARYEFDETIAEFFRESARVVLYFGREFYYVRLLEGNEPQFKIERIDPFHLYQRRQRVGLRNQQITSLRPRIEWTGLGGGRSTAMRKAYVSTDVEDVGSPER